MSIITFPNDLRAKIDDANDPYPHVEFSITSEDNEFHKIHMFIPLAISTSDGITYSSVNLGMVGAVAQTKLASQNLVGQSIGLEGQKSLGVSDFIANTTKKIKAAGGGAGTAATIFELKSGLVVNPYTTQNFDGVTIRSFAFNFKLIPTSAEESKDIHRIENQFRKFMYPKNAGTGALKYPPTFRIRFMTGTKLNQYMPRIIQCYLTNMVATANSTGNAFFKNDDLGAPPTELDLNLTFQEVRAITRDDLYGDGAGLTYIPNYETDGHVVGEQVDSAAAAEYGLDVTKDAAARGFTNTKEFVSETINRGDG